MLSYALLHEKGENFIVDRLSKQGRRGLKESRIGNGCVFDVYDPDRRTAFEVLTAKIVRSSHEADEAIIAKLFRYLVCADDVRFYLVSFDHEEIEMFHSLALDHWHVQFSWDAEITGIEHHQGKRSLDVAKKIFNVLVSYAPLDEWIRDDRRKDHPATRELDGLTREHGLPQHFLVGLWRDWRLMWVWKLEKVLPIWAGKYKLSWAPTSRQSFRKER